jgi:hypothetical protein
VVRRLIRNTEQGQVGLIDRRAERPVHRPQGTAPSTRSTPTGRSSSWPRDPADPTAPGAA